MTEQKLPCWCDVCGKTLHLHYTWTIVNKEYENIPSFLDDSGNKICKDGGSRHKARW